MKRFLLSVLVLFALVGPASADWYGTAHNAACGRMNNEQQLHEELQYWKDFESTMRVTFPHSLARQVVVRGRDFIKVNQVNGGYTFTLARFYTTLEGCMADMRREFPAFDPER